MKKIKDIEIMVQRMLDGDIGSAARLITWVENETEEHHEVMRRVYPHTGKADELITAITEHHEYLQESKAIDRVKYEMMAQELDLVFKDELQKVIFKGLRGTGKKREYINSIIDGENDPYSIVEEVLNLYLKENK